MNKNYIALKKLNKVFVPNVGEPFFNQMADRKAMTLQANVMSLGFIMNEELMTAFRASRSKDEFGKELIALLKKLKGADVTYRPMYPNFPKQVMEASSLELWFNAMIHYWSYGTWTPEYVEEHREYAMENINYIEIGLATSDEFNSIFTKLVGSKESLSEEDRGIVGWFLQKYSKLEFPDEIPYKENMALIGAYMVRNGIDSLNEIVKTATDVLRIATHMSNGDVSLASNTKFKSLKRSQRRALIKALDKVINEEDINRHRGKWVKLAHSLHVGEYCSKRTYEIIKKVRENQKIETFNSKVESLLDKGHVVKATKLLCTRPGEFARRLDHLLRMTKSVTNQKKIVSAFATVADSVSTPVLLQVMGHFSTRSNDLPYRVVFPKGLVQKAELIPGLDALDTSVVTQIRNSITSVLRGRFAEQEDLGNVFIDPSLMDCPLPTQQRSASTSMFSVARGTRIPFGDDKSTLRFFVYWKGIDIDLSMSYFDDNLNFKGAIAYYNLRNNSAYHSGDITYAPNGASEFIDIDIDKMLSSGKRYIAMDVRVYSGPSFADHDICYVGWMTRSHPNSNEIYDPATVEQKLDLTANTRSAIPVLFDLQTREAIWVDLSMNHSFGRPNNVHSNKASVSDVVQATVNNENKVSLFELFELHASARGTLVDDREDADIVFDWNGDVSPKDVSVINSDYLG
jgi:hypothetical protein